MKTVVILDNSIYITGALKSILAIVNKLKDRFYFEFAMNLDGIAAQYVIDAGFKVHDFRFLEISKSWRLLLYPVLLVANAFKLANYARQHDIQIVHVNDFYNQVGIIASFLNWRLHTVYHVRLLANSYIAPIYAPLAWLVRRYANAIVYVSSAAGTYFHNSKKAVLIYDAVTGLPQYPRKLCPEYFRKCRYVYVGNYVRGKGQNYAVMAFKKIANDLPDATLHFVGSGVNGELDIAFVNELHVLASVDELFGRVHFHGPCKDVERLMKDADVVVNLSESESFSMVCLEALTYGLPLIASACGGPSEMVQHQVNGMLVGNRNIDQAAEAMYRLAMEPGLAKSLAEEAYISAPLFASLDTSANKLANVYIELLSS